MDSPTGTAQQARDGERVADAATAVESIAPRTGSATPREHMSLEAQLETVVQPEASTAPLDAASRATAPLLASPRSALRKLAANGSLHLLSGLLLGGLLPALFHWPSQAEGARVTEILGRENIQDGIIGGCVAITVGTIIVRKIFANPHAKSLAYVPYIFGLTYAALAVVLLLLRAPYSRYELGASYLITAGWFSLVQWWSARPLSLRMGIVLGGDLAALPAGRRVRWIRLRSPDFDLRSIDALVADFDFVHSASWKRTMARCALAAIPILDLRQVREQLTGRVEIDDFSEHAFASTTNDLIYAEFKRILDIASALILLPACFVAISISALLIALDSRGPIFFKQARMGYQGRVFWIYKLRTMRHGMTGQSFTVPDDIRVTRIGRILRKYHIDELPQIWNILKGEMSLIGPRPETVSLSEWYEREVPYYSYRHIVRPGVSGWAQVNQGNVGEVDAATEKLQYDFYYIKHLSPWLDMLIAAKTIHAVRTGFGSF